MDAKPADFFVGAMDLFAVLVPGALLAFLCGPWAVREVFGTLLPALDTDAKAWIAFVFGAYGGGHLLHAAGSLLDVAYDKVYTKRKRRGGDELLLVKTRDFMVKDLGSSERLPSAFTWAGSFVRLKSSVAALELDRSGGDSKFFRSLCVLAFGGSVVFIVQGLPIPAIAALAGAALACLRYFKLRWETTQRTYEYFILLKQDTQRKGQGTKEASK